jgi:hypothetical protein
VTTATTRRTPRHEGRSPPRLLPSGNGSSIWPACGHA